MNVSDINTLTGLLEKYRIERSRIKKTPNNPVSSRSHLYAVFEITFDTGKVGYVTIVDTAGRESPVDIYNMFIDTTKRISLTTILGPTGGAGVVKQFMKEQYTDYDATDVFDILKEGFYINEIFYQGGAQCSQLTVFSVFTAGSSWLKHLSRRLMTARHHLPLLKILLNQYLN